MSLKFLDRIAFILGNFPELLKLLKNGNNIVWEGPKFEVLVVPSPTNCRPPLVATQTTQNTEDSSTLVHTQQPPINN